MEIVVCGDSFCSASKHHRLHFSKVLQDKYEYDVCNLARGGASATNICFQLKTALELGPRVVIYSRNLWTRLDLCLQDRKFLPHLGLKNFIYSNPNEESYRNMYVGDDRSAIYSNNIGSLLPTSEYEEKSFQLVHEKQKLAVEQYFLYMHNENLQKEIENWMFEYWELKLKQQNILTLLFNEVGKVAYEFALRKPNYPEVYHTDGATQNVIADSIHELICNSNRA